MGAARSAENGVVCWRAVEQHHTGGWLSSSDDRTVHGGNRPMDRGRERLTPSPPSEPGVQFSRDGLSSQSFPHRDWRANRWASDIVKSPSHVIQLKTPASHIMGSLRGGSNPAAFFCALGTEVCSRANDRRSAVVCICTAWAYQAVSHA